MVKKIFLIIFISLFTVSTFVFILLFGISKQLGQNINYFPSLVLSVIKQPSDIQNIIILGLDKRDDWLEKTSTTDTIILANIHQGQINLISLPRDLWDYTLNTKINQIYPLSLVNSHRYDYIQSQYSRITGLNVDRTLVVTTQNLSDLLKLIGGIDVYLANGFKDDKYPNPEYIKNPHSGQPIYTTIEFKSGWVHLDETNITQFVRSRKSSEMADTGGTDIGRIARQQTVFDALFKKLTSPSLYQNLSLDFKLYRFWYTQIETNLRDADLLSLLYTNRQSLLNFKINKVTIPAGEDPKKDIIYHPLKFINQQWVFITADKNFSTLHQFIRQALNVQ